MTNLDVNSTSNIPADIQQVFADCGLVDPTVTQQDRTFADYEGYTVDGEHPVFGVGGFTVRITHSEDTGDGGCYYATVDFLSLDGDEKFHAGSSEVRSAEDLQPWIANVLLTQCECDNTHETNGTVCRWCWAHGRRTWTDPEVQIAS